jgi:hypothetical protein
MKIKTIIYIAFILVMLILIFLLQPQILFIANEIPNAPTNAHGVVIYYMNYTTVRELIGGNINWVRTDAIPQNLNNIVPIANSHGIKVLAILDYWTMQVYGNTFTLQEWNDTVRTYVEEYPTVQAWEIWNEPTIFHYGFCNGSAYNYYLLLKSAYTIIKSINPDAIVIGLGGVYLTDINWVKQVISYGGLNYCDAVSLHLYTGSVSLQYFGNLYTNMYSYTINSYIQILKNKPIWITETGLMSSNITNYAQNLGNQSQYIYTTMNLLESFNIKNVFWYTWQDSSTAGTWGLVNVNGTLKPSYYAWKNTAGE